MLARAAAGDDGDADPAHGKGWSWSAAAARAVAPPRSGRRRSPPSCPPRRPCRPPDPARAPSRPGSRRRRSPPPPRPRSRTPRSWRAGVGLGLARHIRDLRGLRALGDLERDHRALALLRARSRALADHDPVAAVSLDVLPRDREARRPAASTRRVSNGAADDVRHRDRLRALRDVDRAPSVPSISSVPAFGACASTGVHRLERVDRDHVRLQPGARRGRRRRRRGSGRPRSGRTVFGLPCRDEMVTKLPRSIRSPGCGSCSKTMPCFDLGVVRLADDQLLQPGVVDLPDREPLRQRLRRRARRPASSRSAGPGSAW